VICSGELSEKGVDARPDGLPRRIASGEQKKKDLKWWFVKPSRKENLFTKIYREGKGGTRLS